MHFTPRAPARPAPARGPEFAGGPAPEEDEACGLSSCRDRPQASGQRLVLQGGRGSRARKLDKCGHGDSLGGGCTESVVADPAKMNHSGIKNDDGFTGIGNRYFLCPFAFWLGLLVFLIAQTLEIPVK